jgi:8-oxo-dGTP pyrophosphatase MutT (NUDIX family)
VSDRGGSVWITPGGGLAPGESHRQAALRELREEVGHTTAELGECVWVREHEFTFRGIRYCQRELFFLGRTEPFRIDTSQMEEIELEIVLSHRWWDLDDIEATTGVVFAPRLLGRYLRRLIDGVIPKEPIDVGV